MKDKEIENFKDFFTMFYKLLGTICICFLSLVLVLLFLAKATIFLIGLF